jgi:DNA-binding transcriptional ArsR family regulator
VTVVDVKAASHPTWLPASAAPQTAIASHITVLKDCGLITGRPQVRSVYYRPAQLHGLATLLETAGQLLAAIRRPPAHTQER